MSFKRAFHLYNNNNIVVRVLYNIIIRCRRAYSNVYKHNFCRLSLAELRNTLIETRLSESHCFNASRDIDDNIFYTNSTKMTRPGYIKVSRLIFYSSYFPARFTVRIICRFHRSK